MALIIKREVDLSSLGEEYKDISFIFKDIPAKDYAGIDKKRKEVGEELDKIIPFFIETLQVYFISGKQGKEDLTKEDIAELGSEALVTTFRLLTGQEIDPKGESPSNQPSITTDSTLKLNDSNIAD